MSNLPELSIRGLHNVSESYIDVAKVKSPYISPFPYSNFSPTRTCSLRLLTFPRWKLYIRLYSFPGLSTVTIGYLVFPVLLRAFVASTTQFSSTGFRTFCAMAFKMSNDLGLQDPTSIEMCLSEYERHRRRTTMAAIMHLHMTYNSGTFLSLDLRRYLLILL